ncbi:MAG: hypothetical protein ACTSPY_07525 [Candidatus Helarchaeota archaeon]
MTENQLVGRNFRILLEEQQDRLCQTIEIKDDSNNWIPILKNFNGLGVLIFCKRSKRYSKPLKLYEKQQNSIEYAMNDKNIDINLKIVNEEFIHFKYRIQPKKALKVSKLVANYEILLGKKPEFTWVPHLRPELDHIIPDHIFRAPVVIYKKGNYSFAMIPDLDLINNIRPLRIIMDFNLMPNSDEVPYLYYGFGNYKPVSHIFFKHNQNKFMKFSPKKTVEFGYYILIYKNNLILETLQKINDFLWRKYGKNLLYENLNPQILPYDMNVNEGIKAILERHKCWVDFKINNIECGGFFQNTWLGKHKRKYKFVKPENVKKHTGENISQIAGQESFWGRIIMHFSNSPFWIKVFDKFTRNIPIIKRTAEIWNNAWFLNLRSGYGFRYFGELWNDNNLIKKGNQMLNTVLNLPRLRGAFPSIIFPTSQDCTEISTINGLKAFIPTNDFHLVDTCLTMYWALKFYQDFEKREDILIKSNDLLELLEEIQLENGAIPTYINFEDDKKTPIIKDILINSASSGAPLMFIMEYYKISKNKKCIEIAEKIASYLETEIIPYDKWHDFEIFFSCTHLPFDFYDYNTDSHPMNTLCIYWNASGLIELYKSTKNKHYLTLGERVMGTLSLFQQVWNMPYISYNTYGGFASQNEDAELSDARQALFVRTYIEYYLEAGKIEYIERGIATLRACWAMQLLIEYKEQCPGNIKGINTINGIDRGCVCENYGHSGNDLRVPGYIMFDWGVGSSIFATAYVKKHFGDIFIDFQEKLIFGIDGIIINEYKFNKNQINIDCEVIPNKNYILFKTRKPPEYGCEIFLNKKSIGKKEKEDLINGFKYIIE